MMTIGFVAVLYAIALVAVIRGRKLPRRVEVKLQIQEEVRMGDLAQKRRPEKRKAQLDYVIATLESRAYLGSIVVGSEAAAVWVEYAGQRVWLFNTSEPRGISLVRREKWQQLSQWLQNEAKIGTETSLMVYGDK